MIRHVKITLQCENCNNASTHPLTLEGESNAGELAGSHVQRYFEHHSKCEPPSYVVAFGDSPAVIAGKCGVDWRRWRELPEFNGLKIQEATPPGTELGDGWTTSGRPAGCTLTPGQVLKLPPGWRIQDDNDGGTEPQ